MSSSLYCCFKGLQRVVLFTEDQRVYKLLCENEKVQLAEQEIILMLQNMGVSLVNNTTSQEISFIGITRCCAILCVWSVVKYKFRLSFR